jgi:branched-chain amino acid transport system substrate-binding protein
MSEKLLEFDRRRLLTSIAVTGLAVPFAAADAWAQTGKEPLKFGVTLPLTGSQAGFGADFVTSKRQAVKDINDAGGVNGRPLEMVVLDTQADPALGINAMNRLITVDRLPVVLTAWSAVVKAQAPGANREKTLMLNTGANAPEIANLGDYVYTLFPLADVDITKLAKYSFEKLGKKKAAVLFINNDTGIDAAKIYKAVFEQAGGQVVTYEAYDPKATEFSGMLLKMRAANPEIVHIHGLLTDLPLVIAQMRQLGLQQTVTSYAAGYNPKLLQQLGAAAEGMIVTSLAPGVEDNANVQKLLDRWQAEEKRVPNGLPYNQYAYDSVLVVARLYKHLLDNNKAVSGETMREALLAVKSFDTPMSGKTVIDTANGHRVSKPVYLIKVEKGKFTPLTRLD